jgi:hypothetical protein
MTNHPDDQVRETLRPLVFGARVVAECHVDEATSPDAIDAWTTVADFLGELFEYTDRGEERAGMLAEVLATRIARVLPILGPKHPAWNSLTGLACDLLSVRDGRDPLTEGTHSCLSDYLEELAQLMAADR